MKTYLYLIILFFFISPSQAQQSVNVTDLTIRIPGLEDKSYYFAFHKGDQIILNLAIDKKNLKEFIFEEYAGSIKFQDFETTSIVDKNITIAKTGIYTITLYNSALGGRVARLKVDRIPSSIDSQDFNTGVEWSTVYDTTYTKKTEEYLVSSDTNAVEVANKSFLVSSETNINTTNKTTVSVNLPSSTIKWLYWIGVGQESKDYFDGLVKSLPKAATALGYTNPLIPLGLGLISELPMNKVGEDISYWMTDYENSIRFMNDEQFNIYKGTERVVSEYAVIYPSEAPVSGQIYFLFHNDNIMTGVEVNFRVVAVTVQNQYENRLVKIPIITERQVPIIMDN